MINDIWCISFEEHLQETILVSAKVKKLDLSFNTYYIVNRSYNSQEGSHPFENSPPKDVFLYDGIGDQNILFVEGTSCEGKKEKKFSRISGCGLALELSCVLVSISILGLRTKS